jgi:predicted tellurium resistance membrane protein TerC
MEPWQVKGQAYTNIFFGIVFAVVFTIIGGYGIKWIIESTSGVQATCGVFIIIIGLMGLIDGVMIFKRGWKFIKQDKQA